MPYRRSKNSRLWYLYFASFLVCPVVDMAFFFWFFFELIKVEEFFFDSVKDHI